MKMMVVIVALTVGGGLLVLLLTNLAYRRQVELPSIRVDVRQDKLTGIVSAAQMLLNTFAPGLGAITDKVLSFMK